MLLPTLPKRCPRCATRAVRTESDHWRCPNCGWTDDPALAVPLEQPTAPEISEE